MENLKDKVTNACGAITLAVGAIATFAIAMSLPIWIPAGCGLIASLCAATVYYFTGKGPDGKPLTPIQ
jgi:hypothetical protein